VASWPITTQLKYAHFASDSAVYADTEKFWLALQLKR